MSVRVDSTGDGLMSALKSLHATGVELDDIAMRQPNLDEVFLALTGQPADDDTTRRPLTRPSKKGTAPHDNHRFDTRPERGDGHPPRYRARQEHRDSRASRAAALRAHTTADRARHGPDVAVLPDLPLHVRRRDPHRRNALRRLPRARVPRHRRAVLRHRRPRPRWPRTSSRGSSTALRSLPIPRSCRAHGAGDGGHRDPRLEHRVHHSRSRSRSDSACTARRSTVSPRSGS